MLFAREAAQRYEQRVDDLQGIMQGRRPIDDAYSSVRSVCVWESESVCPVSLWTDKSMKYFIIIIHSWLTLIGRRLFNSNATLGITV